MSNYEPMSAPPPEGSGRPQAMQPPAPIRTAVNIVWAIVALSVVSAALSFLYLDELVESAGADLTATEQDATRFAVIGGAIFGVLVFGALWVVLGLFLRKGRSWARMVLTVLSGIGVVFGLLGLGASQPTVLLVVAVLQVVLEAALLFFMWQKDASAYIQATP